MTERRTRPRKGWVVTVDTPRPPIEDPMLGGVPAETVLAVFPPQWGVDRLVPVVDGFVQVLAPAADKHDYLRSNAAPYRAQVVAWGTAVEGGYNPYVQAFKVEDLVLVEDDETGSTRYEYTRQPVPTPRWIIDNRR